MARVPLPPSQLRARKRRRMRRLALVLGVLVVLVAGACAALAQLAPLRINMVEISGLQTISSSTVEAQVRGMLSGAYAWVIPRDNIFVYPKDAIAQELISAYPVLSSVVVHAVDFHTIGVAVVEREPRALWCTPADSCYFLDENGIVYAQAPAFSAPVYTQYYGTTSGNALPRQYLTAGGFAALSALVDAIVTKIPQEQLAGVAVDANNDVSMRFADGFTLKFTLSDAGGDIFERFTLALSSGALKSHALSELQYLDLRFGDKLYYKLK